jgi:hypothetical protein
MREDANAFTMHWTHKLSLKQILTLVSKRLMKESNPTIEPILSTLILLFALEAQLNVSPSEFPGC